MRNHLILKSLSLVLLLSILAGCSQHNPSTPTPLIPLAGENKTTPNSTTEESESPELFTDDFMDGEGIPTLEEAGLGVLDPTPRTVHELVTTLPNSLEDMIVPVNSEADKDMGTFGASGEAPSETGESTVSTTPPATSSGGLSGAMPTFDIALKGDKKFRVKVNAPVGAKVNATVNGKSYGLTETKGSGSTSIFQGRFSMPNTSGTHDLGVITYTMSNKGKTDTLKSEGKLFSVSTNSKLLVQVKNTSATAFKSPKSRASGTYITTVKKGQVDSVENYYGDMYQLSSVGWVDASAVTPLTSSITLNNSVSSTSYRQTSEGELLTLSGTTHPTYRAVQNQDKIALIFSRTSGVGSIDLSDSRLFSDAAVSTTSGATTITLTLKETGSLWGYVVEYGSGNTFILFRERKSITNDQLPLEGITVVVDPGHGGRDQGAAGLGGGGRGPVEKDLNLATSLVLKNQLESKGANVVMTRTTDVYVGLSDRLSIAQKSRGDFIISLHCNSSSNVNGKGVEVYYHDAISKTLASNISSTLSSETNRVNRGGKNSCYVVTLNSYAPSVLVEMGFMTNASDYAGLQSEEEASAAAKAITLSIIAELS